MAHKVLLADSYKADLLHTTEKHMFFIRDLYGLL